MPSDVDPESSREPETTWRRLETAVAVTLPVYVGVHRELAVALSVGDCVALASVPVT